MLLYTYIYIKDFKKVKYTLLNSYEILKNGEGSDPDPANEN